MKKGMDNMKKTYRMQNLDCANCAAKMERAIQKLEGVVEASVSFMAQKLTLDMEDGKEQQVLEQAKKCVAKVDPDCKILGA